MWAVSERHADAAQAAASTPAPTSTRDRNYVAAANGRGFEGRTPVANRTDPKAEEFASGWLTPLMFAAREGDVELARLLVARRRRRQRHGRRRQERAGAGHLQRQLRRGLVPRRQQGRRQQGRRPAVHAAVLGGRSPQHGDGAELPVDGHRGSAAAHPEAARRRRQSERARQQHAARPHARRLAAHRLRHGADARGIRRRSRAGEAAARSRRRSEDHLEGRRDDGVGGGRPGVHPGLSPRQVTRGAAAGGEAVRRARATTSTRPTTTASRR